MKKGNCIISIIVPVYNVENYLSRCLESILLQSFPDWECILIDDGSSDNSGKICDEYAQQDDRFIVIHQQNSGVSAARNAGLDIAKGQWFSFVDSDDWIGSNFLEELYNSAKSSDVELVECGYWREVSENNRSVCLPVDWNAGACWTKFVSSLLIKKNNIRFPINCTYAEDTFFSFSVLIAAGIKRKKVDLPLYHYNASRNDSAMHIATKDMLDTQVYVTAEMENIAKKAGCFEEWGDYISYRKATSKIDYLIYSSSPDWNMWRNTFPEMNKIRINGKFRKLSFLHVVLLLRIYPLAKLIILYLRNKKNIYL